jgi:hypothetical protein
MFLMRERRNDKQVVDSAYDLPSAQEIIFRWRKRGRVLLLALAGALLVIAVMAVELMIRR